MIPYEELAAALERHAARSGAPMPPAPPSPRAMEDSTLNGTEEEAPAELDAVPLEEEV